MLCYSKYANVKTALVEHEQFNPWTGYITEGERITASAGAGAIDIDVDNRLISITAGGSGNQGWASTAYFFPVPCGALTVIGVSPRL